MPVDTKYTQYVKIMKIALPVGGLFMLAIALTWPYIYKENLKPSTYVDISSPAIIENRMINPKYTAIDSHGRPFEVDAEWGRPTANNAADLITPHGKLETEEHGEVHLDAESGHYDKDTQQLHLEGEVTLETEDGYHFVTDVADVDVNTKHVKSSTPIEGHGPTGKLQAKDGFELEEKKDGNRIIILKGQSRVTITPQTLKKVQKKT